MCYPDGQSSEISYSDNTKRRRPEQHIACCRHRKNLHRCTYLVAVTVDVGVTVVEHVLVDPVVIVTVVVWPGRVVVNVPEF